MTKDSFFLALLSLTLPFLLAPPDTKNVFSLLQAVKVKAAKPSKPAKKVAPAGEATGEAAPVKVKVRAQ